MPTVVRPQPYFGAPQSFPQWGGWYAGAAVTGVGREFRDEIFESDHWSVGGQLFAGYDWQFRSMGQTFVVGGLVGVNYSPAETRITADDPRWGGHFKQTWSADFGIRAGWSVAPKLLAYLSAGGTVGDVNATLYDHRLGTSASATTTTIGWFAGIGAEAHIERHISIRGEYRFGQSDVDGTTLTLQRALVGIAYRR